MKLKIKLPLLYSALTLLLSLLIAIFIKEFLIGKAISSIIETQRTLIIGDKVLSEQIGLMYPDMEAIHGYLEQSAQQGHITVILMDSRLKEIRAYPMQSDIGHSTTWWYEVKDGSGQTVLFLQVMRKIDPQSIVLKTIFQEAFVFLMIALACLFVLLNLYMHFDVTKPIQRLNKRLAKIRGSSIGGELRVSRKDEIGELYRYVREMELRLRQSNQEQVDMIAAITHDIKTPLTSVNGFIELLLTEDSLTEEQRKDYIRLVDKKSRHLTQLISEFSAYTRNELLLPSIALKPTGAKRFFESVANEYEPELAGLEATLLWESSFKGTELIAMDEPMVRRVFANLFSNAVRYARVEELKVSLRGFVKEGEAVFVLEDNGVGVPVASLPLLFQRFFTVDQSRQSEHGGTGLGLASCKSIVERHGGEIIAYRSPLGGLGVRFSIPLHEEE